MDNLTQLEEDLETLVNRYADQVKDLGKLTRLERREQLYKQRERREKKKEAEWAKQKAKRRRPVLLTGCVLLAALLVYGIIMSYQQVRDESSRSAVGMEQETDLVFAPYVPPAALPAETPQPEIYTAQERLDYFVLHCAEEYFAADYLQDFNQEMALVARNAVFAHAGYIFEDEALMDYFSGQSWYVPTVAPDSFQDSILNAFQQANLDLVLAYEQEMGY